MRPLTQEYVQELFEYKDGELYWKKDVGFKTKKGAKAGHLHCSGYVRVTIEQRKYLAHRIIFLMFNKEVPSTLDHINGKKDDNRIENLRKASFQENGFNKSKYKNNTSGIKGIYWYSRDNRWIARIMVDKKDIYLGSFKKIEEAQACIITARNKLHKEFARHE